MTVVALSGGVGGAKLTLGLYRELSPDQLTVVVNTGDDFEHLGLHICPDLDTALYTLANLEHPAQGWGRRDETWTLMRVIESLGEDPWFRLGDADTALHVVRSHRLRAGMPLSAIIDAFRQRLGIAARLLPMTDDRVETRVDTDEGELAFQDYFVRRRCQPRVRAIRFAGAALAAPGPGVCEALAADSLETIVLCPSNPYLSIDPLLAIPGLRAALERRRVPLIAVSPLIGGAAVKGPTGKIMRELGIETTAESVATHYRGLIDALVVDTADAAAATTAAPGIGVPVFATATLMSTLEDRIRLARFVLDRAAQLRHAGRR
ncbi:MAG: 2-phospho-L-lactate transferase [Steroidobacteraceae bacterium]